MGGGTKVTVDEVQHLLVQQMHQRPRWDSEEAVTANAHHIISVLSALSWSRLEHIQLEILLIHTEISIDRVDMVTIFEHTLYFSHCAVQKQVPLLMYYRSGTGGHCCIYTGQMLCTALFCVK